MTTRTLVDSLRDFIGRRRILATRRAAIEQIARQPGHLAADVNVPRRYTPAGITVVIISAIGVGISENRLNYVTEISGSRGNY